MTLLSILDSCRLLLRVSLILQRGDDIMINIALAGLVVACAAVCYEVKQIEHKHDRLINMNIEHQNRLNRTDNDIQALYEVNKILDNNLMSINNTMVEKYRGHEQE